ncbi:MAG: cytochrome-c peroxidase [Bradymonadia bacterium]
MHTLKSAALAAATLSLALTACGKKDDPKKEGADTKATAGQQKEAPKADSKTPAPKPAEAKPAGIDRGQLSIFAQLPTDMPSANNAITEEKISLGRMLYFDKRLSKNHDIACNSCHQLDKYGVDNKPTSPGHKGQLGGRNSPTVYNAGGHLAQFWDGRAQDVEAQAKGPVLNPVEMAMPSEEVVITTLKSMPKYVDAFKAAFPEEADPVTYDNFARAVGAFERKLVTPGPWDKYLAGDDNALNDAQKAGLAKFMETGCTACHNGAYLGGNLYQKVGLVEPWPNQKDQGRFDVTKSDADKMMFKVPSLRNIDRTGPYFHDGSEPDLANAVKLMAKHQLGKKLSDADTQSIVVFLGALTGPLPTDYITEPPLPESTDATPKPDPS